MRKGVKGIIKISQYKHKLINRRMNNIMIIDNFLEEQDYYIALDIISKKKWKYGHISNEIEPVNTPFWTMNLTDEIFFSQYLKEIIENKISKKLELFRVYANGQTFGQDGTYHIDNEDDNTFTFCLYATKINKKDAQFSDGYIHIKIPNEKYIISIEPIQNRGVFFPSNLIHKGCSFSRYIADMRICIAWKMKEI